MQIFSSVSFAKTSSIGRWTSLILDFTIISHDMAKNIKYIKYILYRDVIGYLIRISEKINDWAYPKIESRFQCTLLNAKTGIMLAIFGIFKPKIVKYHVTTSFSGIWHPLFHIFRRKLPLVLWKDKTTKKFLPYFYFISSNQYVQQIL